MSDDHDRIITFPSPKINSNDFRAGEKVKISGRIFLGGNEALDRLYYLTKQGKMLNLELTGSLWLYALYSPISEQFNWVTTPLADDYYQLLGDYGIGLAGQLPMERQTLMKYQIMGLAAKSQDTHFLRDQILKVKSVWWMDEGLSYSLWELIVQELGPLELIV